MSYLSDPSNVFGDLMADAWPYEYQAELLVTNLCGGVPSDPNIAEGWIKSRLGVTNEAELKRITAQIMLERAVSPEEAVAEVNKLKHTNGFKRDPQRGIYIEGRQVKAAFKEAVSVAVAGRIFVTRKRGRAG